MKLKIVICVLAAALVFTGASPWEGAASVASERELPATGRYVATNSFPVNTIVDITNIENNRSVRVIVANNLNSPGLLALVSIEAAEMIGMRPGSVSRIKMVQPSDPIAYLRFTEGMEANIPDYYPGNTLTEEQLLNEVYGTDTYRSYNVDNSLAAQPDGLRDPSYTLEPEWSGRRIIDLPGYVEYPIEITQGPVEEPPKEEEPSPDPVDPVPPVTTPVETALEQPREETAKDIPEYISEVPANEVEKDVTEKIDEQPREETVKDIPEYIAEVPANEVEKDIAQKIDEEPRVEVAKDITEIPPMVEQAVQPPEATQSEFVLVPTEERPPDGTIYGIDPSDIIPEIVTAPPVQETPKPPTPVTPPVTPPVTDTAFSIPRIYSLDYGKYYVQIASVNTPEQVEAVVRRFDRSYEPKVYKDGDDMYRVVLGPLNQGESAAILQRFKSIGFNDAFVRRVTY